MAKQVRSGDAIAIPHYTTKYYFVQGMENLPYFSHEEIRQAAKQAFSVWAAVTPVVFLPRNSAVPGDVNIWLHPQDTGAENGDGLIDINTVKDFFIERFKNYNPRKVMESKGPYDLIGTVCHEIGHNVYGHFNPSDPWEDNQQIGGGMMRGSMSNGQVLRTLVSGDITFAQKKFGKLPVPALVPLKLETMQQIDSKGEIGFAATQAMVTVTGGPEASSLFQVYDTSVKGKMVNAVNIRVKLYSGYAVVNRVEIYDGILPQEYQVLSYSSYSDSVNEVTLKVGLATKHVFATGMLFRIEALFLDKVGYSTDAGHADRKMEIIAITAEEIPRPLENLATV